MPFDPNAEPTETTRRKKYGATSSEPMVEQSAIPNPPEQPTDYAHEIGKFFGVGSYNPADPENVALRGLYGGPAAGFESSAGRQFFGALGTSRDVGAQQAALAEALREQAAGRGPSLAQMQLRQALEQSQAAAQSQLASARGLSPAQAQQMAMRQQAGSRAAMSGQSAQIRLQEQLAAQAALANVLGQQRQQELLGAQALEGMYGTAAKERLTAEELAAQQRQKEQERKAQLTGGVLQAVAGGVSKAALAARGAEIPGKVAYAGDTRSNDTVPALLSPGEIVLPRSVAQDKNAPEKAKSFVGAIKSKKKPTPKDFIQALNRLQELESRMDAMEALSDLEAEEED